MSKIARSIAEAIVYAKERPMSVEEIEALLSKSIDEVKVKIFRESKEIPLPKYAKNGDACMDVYITSIDVKSDGRIIYHTGLHFELPDDYEMEIRPRSSNTKTLAVMQNAPGTLDSNYRGELLLVHRNLLYPKSSIPDYNVGDRIAQILIRRRERIIWDEVDSIDKLSVTDRGEGGFGSTGK